MQFGTPFKPMLLEETASPFDSTEYLFELKFDGIRGIVHASPNRVVVFSRNGKDMTKVYPELQNIKEIVKNDTIFDGEIVLFDNGLPSFSKLQNRIASKNHATILELSKEHPVCFMAFDCLYYNGKSLASKKLWERKEVLSKFKDSEYFIKTTYVVGKGLKLFDKVKKLGLEGIVAKKIDSPYLLSTRSDNWLKIKNLKTKVLVLGGDKSLLL